MKEAVTQTARLLLAIVGVGAAALVGSVLGLVTGPGLGVVFGVALYLQGLVLLDHKRLQAAADRMAESLLSGEGRIPTETTEPTGQASG